MKTSHQWIASLAPPWAELLLDLGNARQQAADRLLALVAETEVEQTGDRTEDEALISETDARRVFPTLLAELHLGALMSAGIVAARADVPGLITEFQNCIFPKTLRQLQRARKEDKGDAPVAQRRRFVAFVGNIGRSDHDILVSASQTFGKMQLYQDVNDQISCSQKSSSDRPISLSAKQVECLLNRLGASRLRTYSDAEFQEAARNCCKYYDLVVALDAHQYRPPGLDFDERTWNALCDLAARTVMRRRGAHPRHDVKDSISEATIDAIGKCSEYRFEEDFSIFFFKLVDNAVRRALNHLRLVDVMDPNDLDRRPKTGSMEPYFGDPASFLETLELVRSTFTRENDVARYISEFLVQECDRYGFLTSFCGEPKETEIPEQARQISQRVGRPISIGTIYTVRRRFRIRLRALFYVLHCPGTSDEELFRYLNARRFKSKKRLENDEECENSIPENERPVLRELAAHARVASRAHVGLHWAWLARRVVVCGEDARDAWREITTRLGMKIGASEPEVLKTAADIGAKLRSAGFGRLCAILKKKQQAYLHAPAFAPLVLLKMKPEEARLALCLSKRGSTASVPGNDDGPEKDAFDHISAFWR